MRCVAHDTHLFQWPHHPHDFFLRKCDFGHKNVFLAHIFVCVSGVRWRMRTKSSGSTLCVHPRARPPAPPTSPTSPSARSCTHGRHFYVHERAGASVDRVGVGLRVCVSPVDCFCPKLVANRKVDSQRSAREGCSAPLEHPLLLRLTTTMTLRDRWPNRMMYVRHVLMNLRATSQENKTQCTCRLTHAAAHPPRTTHLAAI